MGMSASQARLMSLTARLSDLELRSQVISNSKIRLSDESEDASNAYTEALDKQKMTVYNSDNNAYEHAKVNNITSYTSPIDSGSTNSKYRYITNAAGKLIISESDYDEVNDTATYATESAYLAAMGVTTTSTSTSSTTTLDGLNYDSTVAAFQYYHKIWSSVKSGASLCDVISDDKSNNADWLEDNIEAGNLYLYEFDADGGSDGTGEYENVSWTSGDNTLQHVTDDAMLARAEAEYESTMADINSKDERFDLQLKAIDTEHSAIQTELDTVKKVISKNIERSFKIFEA